MKLLLIDNNTKYLPQLKSLLISHTVRIIKYSEIDLKDNNSFDALILSGGHDFSVLGNEDKFKKEILLINTFQKPILGICFGFELIADIFGGKLRRMEACEKGILNIQIIEPDNIFKNISDFQVYENHRWIVEESVPDLKILAQSKDGIEAIKHVDKPIYGVQFHPEMFIDKTCGNQVINNFLNIAKQSLLIDN